MLINRSTPQDTVRAITTTRPRSPPRAKARSTVPPANTPVFQSIPRPRAAAKSVQRLAGGTIV